MTFEEKHLPKTLNDVVFADASVEQKLRDYATGKIRKHLLLFGPPGTGKSVSARLILEQLMGYDAASAAAYLYNATQFQDDFDNFDIISTDWDWQRVNKDHQTVVIDEIDHFSGKMQRKLRAFIDRRLPGMIIGTTNNLHLLDAPLKDRFRKLQVDYPSVQQWVPRVQQIMQAEGFTLTTMQAQSLLNKFTGSGRSLNDWLEDQAMELRRHQKQSGTAQQRNQTVGQLFTHINGHAPAARKGVK